MVMKENIKNKMAAYYVKLENIVDNLTTNDSTKVLSAKQGKKLQDEKLAINQGSGNSGKFLKVDSDGNVSLESVTSMTPSSHNQDLSTINNVSTVTVTITYTDNTTETKNLVVYTSSS